jgi:hypothetical protein
MSYCNAKLMCLFNFVNVVLSMQEHVPDEGPRDAAALLSRPGEGLVGGTRHHKKGLQVIFFFTEICSRKEALLMLYMYCLEFAYLIPDSDQEPDFYGKKLNGSWKNQFFPFKQILPR